MLYNRSHLCYHNVMKVRNSASLAYCVFGLAVVAGFAFESFAAVLDYTRTEKANYNGHEGMTLVTWIKDDGKTTAGRAWAIKVDLTKGYRIRTWYGDGNNKVATVGKMAKCLVDEGETPLVGINGDYFMAGQAPAANGQGALISDSRLMWSGNREFGKVGGYASGAYSSDNFYDMQMFFFETADRKLHHDKLVRIDGKTYKSGGNPSNAYDIAYTPDNGQTYQKVRNAIHTCYVNYPVKAGQPYMMGYFQNRNDYPRTLLGYGKTSEGHEMVVFFVNDGRQGGSGWSFGVSDVDSAAMLIAEGCDEVGEFDGGGSASIWTAKGVDSDYPRDTTADPAGGYLNKPCDGSPRSDASGIFIVTANPNEKTVAKIGSYEYPTFRETMFAVAPNETVELVGDDTCAKPLELATSCKIGSQKQGGAVVTCSAAVSLKAGVCVELENVGVVASTGLTIPATGVLKAAGNLGSMKVVTTAAASLVLTGALTGDLVIDCAAGEGECFAVSSLSVDALCGSLKYLRKAGNATLVAKAVAGADGQTQLVWNKSATLGKITGSDGYDHTNEVVSVEVAALAAGSNLKLRLTARDNAGTEVGVIEKAITAAGTYACDTAEFGQPLQPGRIYNYTAEIVGAGGEVVTDVTPVSATIPAATEFSWFGTQAADGSEVGGKWAEKPAIDSGAFVINPGEPARFNADVGATNIVRATSTMSFEYGFTAASAAKFLEGIKADPPRGALVVTENEAGDPIWAGLVSNGDVLELRELKGAGVEWNTAYVCVVELDLGLDVPRVSYLVCVPGGNPVRLQDKDGNSWFAAAGTCAAPVAYAELRGDIRLTSLTGDREDGSVARVNGIDYGSIAAAANAANGAEVTLYTNVSLDTALLDDAASFKLARGGFDFKAGGAKELVYDESTGLYTVKKVSKGVIFYVK